MTLELCCEQLQFLFDNNLLEQRITTDVNGEKPESHIKIQFVKGFRVKRSIEFLKRDRILYRCPFCNTELIYSIRATTYPEGVVYRFERLKIGRNIELPLLEIPLSFLKKALAAKKLKNKSWPDS